MHRATVDLDASPARISFPRRYNAAFEFIDRHLDEGRGEKIALIEGESGRAYRYADLFERVNRAGNALRTLGLGMEDRVMICLHDGIDFVSVFWGAIKIGAVPVPVNTLALAKDYDGLLHDSRARILVVGAHLLPVFAPILENRPWLAKIVVAQAPFGFEDLQATQSAASLVPDFESLEACIDAASPDLEAADTTGDDVAFWLYTSGSTGSPKGAMHLHRSLVTTCVHYGQGILGVGEDDRLFSVAKLFFAYGLGNAMTFPLFVGATAITLAGRPTPESVLRILDEYRPTIFFGVPTLYAALLSERRKIEGDLRICVSAGEALPPPIGEAWEDRYGLPILDGLGSTEMLHIFLSNRPGDNLHGTTGTAVPGYELRLLDEEGQEVAAGEIGELWVKGDSAAIGYWNRRDRSLFAFHGPWTRTGDKYTLDAQGRYRYCGRTDDMLKVGGQWVSPFEVESALIDHERVQEAAVVAATDDKGLVKPKAFVVLEGSGLDNRSDELIDELKRFVKDRLASHKYPRWIEFTDSLPKTATGKIQRFKLRKSESESEPN
ncbi:benzoate-CoA ligase family protein [Thioalkalivibrio sp. HK1]|uniref:benzoate-CoA ligase family protein n=1 Tax=Thioalkalivibrio sp. HK1 TaxID=1469245 RepID=UPI000471FA27|nr:benzoate-CoA ligase family protein [Thioalkalivibrio sp. HK1]